MERNAVKEDVNRERDISIKEENAGLLLAKMWLQKIIYETKEEN